MARFASADFKLQNSDFKLAGIDVTADGADLRGSGNILIFAPSANSAAK
jgi:hypothetical protein